jgi:hypothetical protein
MSTIIYGVLFAAAVSAANVTTSIWLPGAANANQTFLGSVIEQSGDQTVLSLAFANAPRTPDYFRSAPQQVTVGGTTFVAYNVSPTDEGASNAATVTIELECRRLTGGISAVPTCTLSTLGAGSMVSDLCAGLTVASLPEYCTASSAVNVEQTQTFSGESQYYINNYPLVITAGTEKLGASTAAAPGSGSAFATWFTSNRCRCAIEDCGSCFGRSWCGRRRFFPMTGPPGLRDPQKRCKMCNTIVFGWKTLSYPQCHLNSGKGYQKPHYPTLPSSNPPS